MNQDRAGQFLNRRLPKNNLNVVLHGVLTAPRYAYSPSALLVLEEEFADGSFYQGEIDWDVYKTKARAVILRAGQGAWEDIEFKRNYREAKRVGLARGVYWFYDGRVSPKNQADKLISLIQDDKPEMEIFADWEKNYNGQYEGLRNVVAFMEAVERGLTVTAGMYTGYYFFRENSNPITHASQYAYLKERPLWLGYYASAANVRIPAPWTKLTHWQWGTPAVGLEWGMKSKELDMNFANMTKTEFAVKYLLGDVSPPSVPSRKEFLLELHDDGKVTGTWKDK